MDFTCIQHIVSKKIIGGLNISDFNIGDFIEKLPIAKIYSSQIFHDIRK